jgi:two-component system NtrC family sensor kinase
VLSVEGDDLPEAQEMSRRVGIRTILCVPLLRENESIGTILLRRTEVAPFSDKQIALLQTFADQAVIAIENARLFNETREALERQTATAEILKVIASSPDDVQPVFQAIADRSNRLVNALSTTVFMLNDGMMHLRAFTPTNPEADTALQAMFPAPLSTFSWGESIRRGDIYRVIDTKHEPEGLRDLARLRGWRSCLCIPLLRDGKPIGMIGPTRVEPGPFTDHHVQLLQTFADQAVIAISNVGLFNEVQERTRELSASLDNLRTAQDRLVQTEKLASLGQLTAGIAHEIKNPLNFVNNFSALSAELIDELDETLAPAPLDQKMRGDVGVLTQMLKSNLEKVVQHGKRADSIVKNMLLHSREGSGEHRSADINALVEESLNLAYHGARAEKPGFNVVLKRDLDPDAGAVERYPQEITRALLNLISNGFYAATQRKLEEGETFEPVLIAATKNRGKTIEIRIRDNGTGIPDEVKEKIFNPFFTTKPSGEGTGLGLSMSHDIIVKQHGGSIDVETEPGLFTEFKIVLPRSSKR